MKVYCFGEKEKPVIFLFPGTCCHWKGNFGKVIEPLEEYFRVACVSYDGFDETEQTEFPTMTEETEKIEQYIKKEFGGHICAAYGCSLGGSFVGLLAARGNIHMEYGILGGSDLDQSGKFLAKLMTKLMMPVFYPFIANGGDENSFHEKENGQDAGGGQWLYQSVYGYDKDAGCRYEPYYKKKRRKSVLLRPHYTAAGSDRPVRNADTYFICP